MCPDKETLSAYIDNEVEGRFRDIIARHLGNCDKCRLETDRMLELRRFFADTKSESEIPLSRERVWEKIQSDISSGTGTDIWHKRITVPFPLMAAAAIVLIAFAVSTIINFFILTGGKEYRFNYTETLTINREDDLKLFERDQVLEVDLNLPEDTTFMISGTPRLIREVDYINSTR